MQLIISLNIKLSIFTIRLIFKLFSFFLNPLPEFNSQTNKMKLNENRIIDGTFEDNIIIIYFINGF